VTATGGGATGKETDTGAAVNVVDTVVAAMVPEFEMEAEVWEVVGWDAVRETEGVSPLETATSDEDDAETCTISDEDETLGLSVTVDEGTCVVDTEDTLVVSEGSGAEIEGSGVSLRIPTVSDVEA
jgi:hypothetical protein